MTNLPPVSFPRCRLRKSRIFFIARALCSRQFFRVTRPMGPIQRPTGLPKNSIGSWGAESFEIINTSFKLVAMGNGSMGGNSRSLLVHTLRFRNRSDVALSTRLGTNTLTRSIWTSRLGIASVSGAFAMPSFLLIGLPAITGPLDCRVFRLRRFFRQYGLSCPLLLLRL